MRSLLCGALIAVLSPSAFAATRTWTGATSGNWATASNWGGSAPVAGDDLVFPASGANQTTTNDLLPGTIFNSITLSGGSYVLGGNAIGIGAGGILISGGSDQTIALTMTLTASQTWQITSTSTNVSVGPTNLLGFALTISGDVVAFTGPVTGSGSITVNPDAGVDFLATNTATAPIVADEGVVALSNGSSYPGPITSNGVFGIVAIGKGASAGDVTINGSLFGPGFSSSGPPLGTANTKNLILRNAALYEIDILSASNFNQLSVTGSVDVSGAFLDVSGASVPAGTQFTIVQNDGTDAVIGPFIGSPQGSTVTTFSSGPQNYTIDYHGGDGNDIVITAQNPPTVDTSTALKSTPPAVTQPVTMTATVTPNTGTAIPTGNVTFIAATDSSLTVLGTVALNSSGVATLTAQIPADTQLLIALYSGGGVFARSQDGLPVMVAGSIPALDPRVLCLLAIALAAVGALTLRHLPS